MTTSSVPSEGQNSESIPELSGPQKVKRFCRWLIPTLIGEALGACWAFEAVNGNEGAARLLMFVHALLAVIYMIGISMGIEFPISKRWKPAFAKDLRIYTGVLLAFFLVWHGWIWTPLAVMFNSLAETPLADMKKDQA